MRNNLLDPKPRRRQKTVRLHKELRLENDQGSLQIDQRLEIKIIKDEKIKEYDLIRIDEEEEEKDVPKQNEMPKKA